MIGNRIRILVFCMTSAVVLLAGCAPKESPRAVGFPKRIIAMAPSIAEMLFAVGAGEKVVGVSDFCTYPPEVKNVPVCGGYMNPNYEQIKALRPDLVVIQGVFQEMRDFCAESGIPLVEVDMDSIESIIEGARTIGKVTGFTDAAEKLATEIENASKPVPVEKGVIPKKVLLVIGRLSGDLGSISTVGGSSFLSEVVEIVGGKNVFSDIDKPYPQVSMESVLVENPDVIIEFRLGENISDAQKQEVVSQWKDLKTVSAVRNDRVYVVTEDYALLPGPRVTLMIELMWDLIQSEGKKE